MGISHRLIPVEYRRYGLKTLTHSACTGFLHEKLKRPHKRSLRTSHWDRAECLVEEGEDLCALALVEAAGGQHHVSLLGFAFTCTIEVAHYLLESHPDCVHVRDLIALPPCLAAAAGSPRSVTRGPLP